MRWNALPANSQFTTSLRHFYKLVVGCFFVLSCFTLDANHGPVNDFVLLGKRVAVVVMAKSVTK